MWTLSFLAERCNLHCKVQYVRLLSYYSLCLLSLCRLRRECIVTRQLKLESRVFHIIKVALALTFSMVSLTAKFEGAPLGRLKLGWGGYRLRDDISQKRCEIELR